MTSSNVSSHNLGVLHVIKKNIYILGTLEENVQLL